MPRELRKGVRLRRSHVRLARATAAAAAMGALALPAMADAARSRDIARPYDIVQQVSGRASITGDSSGSSRLTFERTDDPRYVKSRYSTRFCIRDEWGHGASVKLKYHFTFPDSRDELTYVTRTWINPSGQRGDLLCHEAWRGRSGQDHLPPIHAITVYLMAGDGRDAKSDACLFLNPLVHGTRDVDCDDLVPPAPPPSDSTPTPQPDVESEPDDPAQPPASRPRPDPNLPTVLFAGPRPVSRPAAPRCVPARSRQFRVELARQKPSLRIDHVVFSRASSSVTSDRAPYSATFRNQFAPGTRLQIRIRVYRAPIDAPLPPEDNGTLVSDRYETVRICGRPQAGPNRPV